MKYKIRIKKKTLDIIKNYRALTPKGAANFGLAENEYMVITTGDEAISDTLITGLQSSQEEALPIESAGDRQTAPTTYPPPVSMTNIEPPAATPRASTGGSSGGGGYSGGGGGGY